ncbi:MAG TPA: MATE family efflux transporter [Hyphomicrobiaceae bacterium]|nr:MATE family efflux transporter [Hyphomicrobiaceae bacterium]
MGASGSFEHDRSAVGHGAVLRIALPITLSNATGPLTGVALIAVIGQSQGAAEIGGVAVAVAIFSMLLWTFSFLRMATTGLAAQALGAGDRREIAGHGLRALLVAACGGVLLIMLQWPIAAAALELMRVSPVVAASAREFFDLRVWSMPAALVNFAVFGWLIGLGQARRAFEIQLVLNVLNVALAAALVLGLGFGVRGLAVATVIAECLGMIAGLWVARREAARLGAVAPLADAVDLARLRRSMAMNSDIAIRALAHHFVLAFFTSEGAAQGDATLAANAILYNLLSVMIFLLDGFAFAAETFVGQAIGAQDRQAFEQAARITTRWAVLFAVIVGVVAWFAGDALIALAVKSEEVRAEARTFLVWIALSPLAGVWAFQLDGIFVGATRSRDMRNTMLASVAAFFVFWWPLSASFGNHGLWAAYTLFFVVRAILLGLRLPGLVEASFAGRVRHQ